MTPEDAFAWGAIALGLFIVAVLWRTFKSWANARYPGWQDKKPQDGDHRQR